MIGSGREDSKKCIPFVSEYTDCTDENQCSGCSKCTCSAQGDWSCETVDKCASVMEHIPLGDEDIDSALIMLEEEMKRDRLKAALSSKSPLVPSPPAADERILGEDVKKFSIEDEIMDLMRPKRSAGSSIPEVENSTVKFHHTLDEIYEDTLKNVNQSGTIHAKKLDIVNIEKLSRRTDVLPNKNSSNSLQIEFNNPMLYDPSTDHNIDTTIQSKDSLHGPLPSNLTQQQKNKDLSKLIANELKSGLEVIGDKNAPIMSNVSFTPENDTLTAMTFIAGNLLNKLWNMEKDSSESIEIEVMKHQKIADLLEIFKEPLTIRQETFLKNTLKHLSNAIDKTKDIDKVLLCESIEQVKKKNMSNFTDNIERYSLDRSVNCKTEKCKQKTHKAEAITKMNNIIDLVQKFKNVSKQVNYLKQNPTSKHHSENLYTNKTENSLNIFGGILDKIIKLILPDKRSKSVISSIKSQNIYGDAKWFEKQLNEVFNINIQNLTITAKDKLVLDYLQHVNSNPDCVLKHKIDNNVIKLKSNLEGNILVNLFEFFKIKSLGNLVQLMSTSTESKNKKLETIRTHKNSNKDIKVLSTQNATTVNLNTNTKYSSDVKEKLKAHLKNILEDIMEMQNAKGSSNITRTVEITDILPCVYNILNESLLIKPKKQNESNSIEKVAVIFKNLKKDLQYTQNNRRTNSILERPKSATVWDRVIKNLNDKYKLTSRRSLKMANIPKTYEQLKKGIDESESGSNIYKTFALFNEVPAAERFTLLKTFDMDVKQYIDVLNNIKAFLNTGKLTENKLSEVAEYIHNLRSSINLNKRILNNMNEHTVLLNNIDLRKGPSFKNNVKPIQRIKVSDKSSAYGVGNTKITRDQIINQLIKNRLKLFMMVKEASRSDTNNDMHYDIARKILQHLERGNYVIARELYKVFAAQHQRNNIKGGSEGYHRVSESDNPKREMMREKEPILQFDETKMDAVPLLSHENLLKQLINMKNLKI